MGDSPQHSVFQKDGEIDSIFHVLDEDSIGYITVEKFTSALNSFIPNQLPPDKLNSLLENLDPYNEGRIFLEDFKHAIVMLQSIAASSDDQSQPQQTLRISQASSNGISGADPATPTGDDFSGADGTSKDADDAAGARALSKPSAAPVSRHDSGSWATAAAAVDQLDSAIQLHDLLDASAGGGGEMARWQSALVPDRAEESYEDWGSGELGAAGCLIDLGSNSPPYSSTPGEAGASGGLKPPLPPDADASQSLERGTEVRGTWPRHRPSLHRPPSANQLAQHLYTSSGRSSPRTSGDGMFYDEADYSMMIEAGLYNDEMKSTLKLLNERIEQLSSSLSMSDSRHNKLIEENQLLRERLNRQEDDFREAEAKLRRKIDEDKTRAKTKLAKVTNEKEAETERLIEKLRQAESSLAEQRVESTRHRAEAERLRAENSRYEERAETLDSRLGAARDEAERQRDLSRRELDTAKRDRDQAQALVEELNRELDSWRSGTSSGVGGSGGRDRATSAAEMLSRYREVELLAKRLTQENKSLREQLEESQAELLTRGLEEGQALLRRHNAAGSASLAAELETMTKDELMDLLVREKDGNDKLRNYIDRILLRIMEKQPDLLEVGFLA